MNKWLFIDERIFNLNQSNRINYEIYDGKWVLWLDYDDELVELFKGNEKKIKRKFKKIKDFLKSSENYLEME